MEFYFEAAIVGMIASIRVIDASYQLIWSGSSSLTKSLRPSVRFSLTSDSSHLAGAFLIRLSTREGFVLDSLRHWAHGKGIGRGESLSDTSVGGDCGGIGLGGPGRSLGERVRQAQEVLRDLPRDRRRKFACDSGAAGKLDEFTGFFDSVDASFDGQHGGDDG